MSPRPTPRIEILGVYSPSADHERYEQVVAAYAASCDPANLPPRLREEFIRNGRDVEPLSPEGLKDAEFPIRFALSDAVYIEATILNVDQHFDAGQFTQADPNVPKERWQVAWNETYLSLDGETVLSGYPYNKAPKDSTLRVVFVIHCWNEQLPLGSSYGDITCPSPKPLPERLWRLAPYEMVD
jgi:hypothetical protein